LAAKIQAHRTKMRAAFNNAACQHSLGKDCPERFSRINDLYAVDHQNSCSALQFPPRQRFLWRPRRRF
jgi:hypothetical protein